MSALIISNAATFGQMTNSVIGRLAGVETSLERLAEAIATASSGYQGTPGTEFEMPANALPGMNSGNNFGVTPDPANPGAQGQSYRYAVDNLKQQWDTFWGAAQPFIAALDNGTF